MNSSADELEGQSLGYFAGFDYDRDRYFVGLEANILQPHCDYYDNYRGPCGDNNTLGIRVPGEVYENFVNLVDWKVRLGTNLGTDNTRLYGIAGVSTGLWDDDENYYGTTAALLGLGAEFDVYQGVAFGAEFISRASTSGSGLDYELNTFQVRMLYRY